MHENTQHDHNITDEFKDYDGMTDEESEIGNQDQTLPLVELVTLLIIGQYCTHGSTVTSTKIQRLV